MCVRMKFIVKCILHYYVLLIEIGFQEGVQATQWVTWKHSLAS